MNNDTVEIIIRTVNQALPGIKQAIKQLNLIEKAKIKLKDMPVSLKETSSFNGIRDRLRGITDSVKSKIPINITGNDEIAKTNTLISRLRNNASKLKNIPVNLKITKSFNTVRDRLKNIADSVKNKIPINVSSERIDAATDRFKRFTASIGGAVTKTVALGAALGVVGAATAAIGFAGTAVGLGSQLQQQQISMRHFIGVSNAGMDSAALDKMTSDYMAQLQKNANYTPFSQGEVMEAGTRALSVADGDTKKAMEFVERFKLDPKQKIKTMSKGMQEKVQLLLVMSRAAKLYLLDEPLGGVDPAARENILNIIMDNYAEKSTLILSTHMVNDLEASFNHVMILGHGRVLVNTSVDNVRKSGKTLEEVFKEVIGNDWEID